MNKVNIILSSILITIMIFTSCGDVMFNETTKSNETISSNMVTIGKQVWMTKNLNVDKFRNGDTIPEVKTDEEWKKAGENGEPAWCFYYNYPEDGDRYGKLYNWHAVNDPRGLAPEGWKIPSDEDWSRLVDFLGGDNVAGIKMKSSDYWAENNSELRNNNNNNAFLGLPGGYRELNGRFHSDGLYGFWWSSKEGNSDSVWCRYLSYEDNSVGRSIVNSMGEGFSVRCLKE